MSNNTLTGAEIVSAYISNNSVPASELPALIRSVIAALDNLGKAEEPANPAPKLEPAVPIKRSVQRDFIVSLENGKRFRTLKRHLSTLGMTPDDYRRKWGLPVDYPMVAQAYSQQRSEMSKARGLGRRTAAEQVEATSTSEPIGSNTEDEPMVEEPEEVAEVVQEAA